MQNHICNLLDIANRKRTMPIHVDIRINDALIDTLHIGRADSFGGHEVEHTYLVTNEVNNTRVDWSGDEAVEFTHKYSEGAHICVAKALEAWDKARREKDGV
jgi:hypothetical protein